MANIEDIHLKQNRKKMRIKKVSSGHPSNIQDYSFIRNLCLCISHSFIYTLKILDTIQKYILIKKKNYWNTKFPQFTTNPLLHIWQKIGCETLKFWVKCIYTSLTLTLFSHHTPWVLNCFDHTPYALGLVWSHPFHPLHH